MGPNRAARDRDQLWDMTPLDGPLRLPPLRSPRAMNSSATPEQEVGTTGHWPESFFHGIMGYACHWGALTH